MEGFGTAERHKQSWASGRLIWQWPNGPGASKAGPGSESQLCSFPAGDLGQISFPFVSQAPHFSVGLPTAL